MIKSNRDWKDIIDLRTRRPAAAKGKVCIDLTDPLTGKVKERVKGENLVFGDLIFTDGAWQTNISSMWMCLNDSAIALDPAFSLLMGQTVGYGRPTTAGLGTYRGAYNAASQVLAVTDLSKARWKFQYDFTTAQANGTIRNVGLTRQYEVAGGLQTPVTNINKGIRYPSYTDTSDGRYSFSISAAGVVTRYDWWLGVTATIDLSITVGSVAGNPKSMGYAPSTGKYYVWVYSATAGQRKLYQFSDASLTTLENTYSPSNVIVAAGGGYAFYVYGNKMYVCAGNNSIQAADFIANTAYVQINLTTYNFASDAEYPSGSYARSAMTNYGSMGVGKYIVSLCTAGFTSSKGLIFDMSTETIVGYVGPYLNSTNSNYQVATYQYPIGANKLICQNNGAVAARSALTSYLLPVPVTKTAANGMTASYELEVYW